MADGQRALKQTPCAAKKPEEMNFLRLFGVFYAAFPSKDCKRQKTRRIRNPVFRAQEKGVSRKSKSLSRFGFPKAGRRNVTGCKESPRIFKNDRMKLQNLTGRRRVREEIVTFLSNTPRFWRKKSCMFCEDIKLISAGNRNSMKSRKICKSLLTIARVFYIMLMVFEFLRLRRFHRTGGFFSAARRGFCVQAFGAAKGALRIFAGSATAFLRTMGQKAR